MIKARLLKARRLLDLHKSLQRIEEECIAGLKSRQAELAAQQEEMIGSLSGNDGLHGAFMPVIVRRLKLLSEEATRIGEEIERRTRGLQALGARTKYAERMSRTYEQQQTKARAEKELLDIIERSARPDDASLP